LFCTSVIAVIIVTDNIVINYCVWC